MRRALILLFLVALLLLLVWRPDLSHWPRWTRESASERPSASAPDIADSTASSNRPTQSPPPPSSTQPSSLPDRAAAAWLNRAQAALLAARTKSFGPQVAALMAQPPSEAWPRLKTLADAGDANANTAAAMLATECGIARAWLGKGSRAKGNALDAMYKGLPQEQLDLLQAIDARLNAQQFARYTDCTRIDSSADFVNLAERSLRGDDPSVQLYVAAEIENDAEAIAMLRDLAQRMDTDDARRALAERLMRSTDSAQQHEGQELLEALSVDDPRALALLADCLRNGCGHFAGDSSIAQAWLERAAGGGDWFALSQLVDDFSAAHAPLEAWAWARYRLELASAGCFNDVDVTYTWLAESIRAIQHLDGILSAAQRLEAEARWRALSARWLAVTHANQACSP